jgi:hypothetical protein
MTAEQKARDMLERMSVEDAQSFSAGDLVELANLIADKERIAAALDFISTADGGSGELFPSGPSSTEYEEDGNTIRRHIGPWRFLFGVGESFLAAVEDSMRKERG